MRFRKFISVLLCVAICLSVSAISFTTFAADTNGKLTFNADGSFRIMMINDTQDDDHLNKRTKDFVTKAIENEKPNLIVVAGDILSDIWPFCKESELDANFIELFSIFEEAKVPFAITMGNHDHDRVDDCSTVEHLMEVATSFSMHVSTADGCDPATYSVPIYSHDGSQVEYVVYMVDSNNRHKGDGISGYEGPYQYQIDWLRATAAQYKENNNGVDVPSTIIQHIPVLEIYNLMVEVPLSEYIDKDAVYDSNSKKWYKLNKAEYPDITGVLGEAPCSEAVSSGEYQAMVDIKTVSAFFAHDHVNSFGGTTDEGVYLGYNSGTGFNAYGKGDKRTIRLIDLDENDLRKVDTHLIYYSDVCDKHFNYYYTDILSTALLTYLMKAIFLIPSLFAKAFNK